MLSIQIPSWFHTFFFFKKRYMFFPFDIFHIWIKMGHLIFLLNHLYKCVPYCASLIFPRSSVSGPARFILSCAAFVMPCVICVLLKVTFTSWELLYKPEHGNICSCMKGKTKILHGYCHTMVHTGEVVKCSTTVLWCCKPLLNWLVSD